MRVIKFRGYCDRDSEWRFGSYATDGANHEILTPLDNGHLYSSVIGCDDIDSIGQFTGLHDKNGVEIYEGDIVLLNDHFVSAVEFFGCSFVVKTKSIYANRGIDVNPPSEYETVEVIGNIHETPELLK